MNDFSLSVGRLKSKTKKKREKGLKVASFQFFYIHLVKLELIPFTTYSFPLFKLEINKRSKK